MAGKYCHPSFRFDIEIEADLIEELGRIYGYDRLPCVPLTGGLEMRPVAETTRDIGSIADVLVARGYQEAVTYSFVDPELQGRVNPGMTAVRLANPISSEMTDMRTSLWPGLLTGRAAQPEPAENARAFLRARTAFLFSGRGHQAGRDDRRNRHRATVARALEWSG